MDIKTIVMAVVIIILLLIIAFGYNDNASVTEQYLNGLCIAKGYNASLGSSGVIMSGGTITAVSFSCCNEISEGHLSCQEIGRIS